MVFVKPYCLGMVSLKKRKLNSSTNNKIDLMGESFFTRIHVIVNYFKPDHGKWKELWILSQGKSVSSFDVRWSYLIFGSLILIQIIPMECTHDKDPCYTQHIWRICLNRFLESLTTEFSENTSNTRYDCHYQWGPDVLWIIITLMGWLFPLSEKFIVWLSGWCRNQWWFTTFTCFVTPHGQEGNWLNLLHFALKQ